MLNPVRQRGFNLIETMVTVSVLGILLAASVPSMVDWIRAIKVRNIAETTQAGLQKARTEAMKRNQVVSFWMVSPETTTSPGDDCVLSTASGAWVVSGDNPTSKCATAPSLSATPRIVETYGPGPTAADVVIAATDAGGTPASFVSFNGFGQRVGAGIARIDVTHNSGPSVRPLRIQISTSGGIRMCDPAVGATDPRFCP